jgi:Skp family chaperone for outer membrane proteins
MLTKMNHYLIRVCCACLLCGVAQFSYAQETSNNILQADLQKILQELQQLEQENIRLEQALQEALDANQALDAEIEKIRPEVASLPLPPQ